MYKKSIATGDTARFRGNGGYLGVRVKLETIGLLKGGGRGGGTDNAHSVESDESDKSK